MSAVRKYANLPDLVGFSLLRLLVGAITDHYQDPAPDIYETPELTDDTSTYPVGFKGR